MLKFTINGSGKEYTFNLPENIGEIDAEYLKTITAHVNVADHYSLIGVVYHESVAAISLARAQKKKGISAGIIPIFIKCGKTDDDFIKSIKLKDKLLIGNSAIELGYRVATPSNDLNLDKFIGALDMDKDSYAKARAVNNQVFFIDFKIIPNNEIKAFYTDNVKSMPDTYITISDNKVVGDAN